MKHNEKHFGRNFKRKLGHLSKISRINIGLKSEGTPGETQETFERNFHRNYGRNLASNSMIKLEKVIGRNPRKNLCRILAKNPEKLSENLPEKSPR